MVRSRCVLFKINSLRLYSSSMQIKNQITGAYHNNICATVDYNTQYYDVQQTRAR